MTRQVPQDYLVNPDSDSGAVPSINRNFSQFKHFLWLRRAAINLTYRYYVNFKPPFTVPIGQRKTARYIERHGKLNYNLHWFTHKPGIPRKRIVPGKWKGIVNTGFIVISIVKYMMLCPVTLMAQLKREAETLVSIIFWLSWVCVNFVSVSLINTEVGNFNFMIQCYFLEDIW